MFSVLHSAEHRAGNMGSRFSKKLIIERVGVTIEIIIGDPLHPMLPCSSFFSLGFALLAF